jgi:hypothetical protein
LVFESTPPKALVRVDGEVAGEAPFEREVEPGEHTAEASLDGHVTQRRQIEAVAGVRSTITFDLPPVPRSVRYRKLRLFGWTALGVGAAALVAGPVLIGIDGRENRTMCSGDDVDAQGDCRLLYATSEAGIAVTVIGGALLATGIGIAIGTRDRRTGATADVFAHPRGIVVRARF